MKIRIIKIPPNFNSISELVVSEEFKNYVINKQKILREKEIKEVNRVFDNSVPLGEISSFNAISSSSKSVTQNYIEQFCAMKQLENLKPSLN